MMRVLVCGGRHYYDLVAISNVLHQIHAARPISVIVQGGATGADAGAKTWALKNGINAITYAAEWKKHGKGAGPKRNQVMLDREKPDLVVAFPGGAGTADMVRRAKAAGINVRDLRDGN